MTKYLFVSAEALDVRTGDHGEVFMRIEGLGGQLKLAEGVEIVLHLIPDEADHLAEALARMARVARAQFARKQSSEGTPPHEGE